MRAEPWFHRYMRQGMRAAFVACMALSAGCGVYQAGVRTSPGGAARLPPTDPSALRIFGGDSGTLHADEVGFVIGVADIDEEELALRRVRSAAAALGADAIVDLRFEIHQDQLVARARAVRLVPGQGGQP